MARNTIPLIVDLGRRYEEALASVALYPGYLCQRDSDGKMKPHTVRGGRAERAIAIEDGMIGNTVTTQYAIGSRARYMLGTRGEVYNLMLKAGETIVIGDMLISAGDGTMVKAASAVLANVVADSTAITSTSTETTFSNGTVAVPANTLKVGDRLRIRARGIITASNSTDTLTVKIKIGSSTILTVGPVDVANSDIFLLDALVLVRTIGSGGTIVGSGFTFLGTPAAAPVTTVVEGSSASSIESTTLDTTAAASITVTATFSSTNSGNSTLLRELSVEQVRGTTNALDATGGDLIACAEEALDLSLASADALCPMRII